MKLTTDCKKCTKAMTVKPTRLTRLELKMVTDKIFDLDCKKCGHTNQVHVDEVEAVSSVGSFIVPLILVAAGLFLTSFFLNLGYFSVIGLAVMITGLYIYSSQEERKMSDFNSLKVDEDNYRRRLFR